MHLLNFVNPLPDKVRMKKELTWGMFIFCGSWESIDKRNWGSAEGTGKRVGGHKICPALQHWDSPPKCHTLKPMPYRDWHRPPEPSEDMGRIISRQHQLSLCNSDRIMGLQSVAFNLVNISLSLLIINNACVLLTNTKKQRISWIKLHQRKDPSSLI